MSPFAPAAPSGAAKRRLAQSSFAGPHVPEIGGLKSCEISSIRLGSVIHKNKALEPGLQVFPPAPSWRVLSLLVSFYEADFV
jgi:hypothetical protein